MSIVGTKGAASFTNTFPISASPVADIPIFIIPADVQDGAGDGTLIGAAESVRAGTTFSIADGRTDLFYLDGANLKLTNSADWGGIGTTNYVTLRAVKGNGTNELVVAASVVAISSNGTVFRFR